MGVFLYIVGGLIVVSGAMILSGGGTIFQGNVGINMVIGGFTIVGLGAVVRAIAAGNKTTSGG